MITYCIFAQVKICNAIIDYEGFKPALYRRKATTATSNIMVSQSNVIVPDRLPDAAIVDLPPGKTELILPVSWLHAPILFEAKISNSDAPLTPNQRESTIKAILPQAADYARLHMSLRPFQNFSIIVFFHGSTFSISYWDRSGVVATTAYDLRTEKLTLVRLIRRLGRELDLHSLGLDESVQLNHGDTYFTRPYPSYRVWVEGRPQAESSEPTGLGGKYWVTVGAPISQTLGFIGRGTTVWKARIEDPHEGVHQVKDYVLKNSWRHGDRTTESQLYLTSIPHENPGVARFAVGGDVIVRGTEKPTTTYNSRRLKELPWKDTTPKATLHRLVLKSLGKPLWEYRSEDPKSLVRAIRDAIIGKYYCLLFRTFC